MIRPLGLMLVPFLMGATDPPTAPEGMVWIPGGTFEVGSESPLARPEERPVHRATVSGFFMDRHEVTNAQFEAFVTATGYVTVAERPIDWEVLSAQLPPGTPKPPPEVLKPGALVFTPPDDRVPLRDYSLDRAVFLGFILLSTVTVVDGSGHCTGSDQSGAIVSWCTIFLPRVLW